MKILAIGDFHGKFPSIIPKMIKKEDINIIISNGDYLPFAYRKLWFKHCFRKDIELWEIIGKKKYKKLITKDFNSGLSVIKKLNNLSIPVISVLGNVDYPSPDDIKDIKKKRKSKNWIFEKDRKSAFKNLIKNYKNIKLIDYKFTKIKDLIFIGARGHSNTGNVKSNAFRKHKEILAKLFRRFRKENKDRKVIFLSHNVPYNTKLDKIGMKAHKLARGKHLGSKIVRRTIDKFHPVLHIGGHIHESRGTQKIGDTLAVNPGAIHEGHYAIINLENGKVKAKLI